MDGTYVMTQTNIRHFSIFNIKGNMAGGAIWNNGEALTANGVHKSQIQAIRGAGGDVVVGLGGAFNQAIELDTNITTAAQLAAVYQTVIDSYNFPAIDFDIEGAALDGPVGEDESVSAARRTRIVDALAIMQANNPTVLLNIIFTTTPPWFQGAPPDYGGIPIAMQDFMTKSAAAGINAVWTGMAFDISGPGQDMVVQTITANDHLASELQTLYGYSSAEAYRHTGISTMNGETDTGEVVSLSDFSAMLAYAQLHDLGRLSFWALKRDRSCDAVNVWDHSCDRTTHNPLDFTKILDDFV